MIIGLYLLSRMDASTSRLVASAYMFVLGLGLGLVMQVLVLAVQNSVDYTDPGVATSGATLFRSIGGSVGTAVLGSIFSSRRLRPQLQRACERIPESPRRGSPDCRAPAPIPPRSSGCRHRSTTSTWPRSRTVSTACS